MTLCFAFGVSRFDVNVAELSDKSVVVEVGIGFEIQFHVRLILMRNILGHFVVDELNEQ